MRILFFCMCWVLLLIGCKKDIASNDKVVVTPVLVSVKAKQSKGNSVLNENTYSGDSNIKTRVSYKDYILGLISAKADYLYDGDKLIQIDDQVDYSSSTASTQYSYSRIIFDYTNNRISQRNNFLKNGDQYELRSFAVFEYNQAELPEKETRYTADGALSGYSIHEYAASGNVISSSEYGVNSNNPTPVLLIKRTYYYDTHNNPYKKVYSLVENIPFSVNANNVTQTVSVNYSDPGNPQTTITQTIYAYNDKGFPVYMNEDGNEFLLEYK
jgi:hypothetical protein